MAGVAGAGLKKWVELIEAEGERAGLKGMRIVFDVLFDVLFD